VLSTITWNTTMAPKGGAWNTPGNWQGGVVPTSTDNAVIDLTSAGTVTTGPSDSVLSLSTNASTTVSVSNGSLTLGSATSTIGGPLTVSGSGTLALSSTTLIGTGSVTDAGQLTASNTVLGLSSTTMSTGSALNINGVTVQPGATLSVGANVPVLIGGGQAITDNGTLSFGSGDSVGLTVGYYATTQIDVNGVLKATGTNFYISGGNSGSFTLIQVNSGGELIASNTTFGVNQLTLSNGSVLKSGDLSNDVFNLPIYVPALDIPLLASNQSFQAINILDGSLNNGQSLTLSLIGTKSTANLSYDFYSGFTVQVGASLTIAPDVSVLIGGGQTLTDNGTMTVGAGAAVGLVAPYYATTQIDVNGVLKATGTNFYISGGNSGSFTLIQVNSGGELIASNTTFGVNQLSLTSGSTGQLAVDAFNTQLAISSGATIGIANNGFSNGTVVASGDSTATISLADNYWGTTNTTQIAAKITDHSDNSSLPTVKYTPPLSTASPAGAVSATAATNTSTTFKSASQTITLSATVTSGATKINEGTETFTILSGINIIGKPVTVAVANGVATTSTYTLPAGTAAGSYTIQTIYFGTGNYLGSIDASHVLTVNAAATTIAAKSASTTFSTVARSVPLSATVSSAAGAVNGGTVTFTILNGATTIATATSNTVNNGAAGAPVTLPAGTAINNYTIQAVYSGTGNFSSSTDKSQVLKVSSTGTTTTVSSSASSAVFGQSVTVIATVIASSPGLGTPTGSVTFKNGTTALATETLTGGTTTFTTSSLALGAHSITAVYNGSTNFATSTSTALTDTVAQDGTTSILVSSANPSAFGQAVVFTAVEIPISPGVGTPTGTVTFKDGTTALATETLSGGTATFFTSALAIGTHSITVAYSGDTHFKASTSTALSQVVNQASSNTTVTSSADPSVSGKAVTFTAQVTAVSPGAGTPTGTVTFKNGATTLGTGTLSGGVATYTTSTLVAGSHSITVVYGGDTHFKTSTSPMLNQTVQSSGSAAIAAANVSSVETSIAAIQTGMPATPSVQDLALKQVSTEQTGHRHGSGRPTAKHNAQIKVIESLPRFSRRVPFFRTTGAHRPAGVRTRESIARENRRQGAPKK
jgi:hypothetical protein